jgi:beta-lactamase class A
MLNSKVAGKLLSSTLPYNWRIGDKSGSGGHGTRNDVGIILRPDSSPLLAAVYYTEAAEVSLSRDAVVAEVGQIIFEAFSS